MSDAACPAPRGRTLWLVRHARPLVAPGTCYGRLDMEADDGDTRRAARALAGGLPRGAGVAVSPLRRCRQLAVALEGLRPDLGWHTDARLAEMDLGAWEGRPWAELGAAAVDAWRADFAGHAPGGGETVAAFMRRVARALDEVPPAGAVWITHAGVMRAAGLVAAGRREVFRADEWPRQDIAFGSCQRLEIGPPAPHA